MITHDHSSLTPLTHLSLLQMGAYKPDWALHLGDPYDLHGLDFMPSLSSASAQAANRRMRQHLAWRQVQKSAS
jgi:hypothetical protein